MDKQPKDSFEIINKGTNRKLSDNNFFVSTNSPFRVELNDVTMPTRRLNDYDSTLLEEGAYKDIDNTTFKMEYKLSRIENLIKDLYVQLKATKEIHDYDTAEVIQAQINQLEAEYQALIEMYDSKSISSKISGSVLNVFGSKFNVKTTRVSSNFSKISNSLISKLPKVILDFLNIKKSLSTLEEINKSVNSLMSMHIPYGENTDKYNQISKYIIKANAIQNDISKKLR